MKIFNISLYLTLSALKQTSYQQTNQNWEYIPIFHTENIGHSVNVVVEILMDKLIAIAY